MMVHSFYDFATFYRRFVQDFSTIMTLIMDCIRKEAFEWTKVATKLSKRLRKGCKRHIFYASQISQKCLRLHVMHQVLI